jgi:hypothetical protein
LLVEVRVDMVLLRVVEVRVDIVPEQVILYQYKIIPLQLVLEVLIQLVERLHQVEIIARHWDTHQPLAVAVGGTLMLVDRVALVVVAVVITGLVVKEPQDKDMQEDTVIEAVVDKLVEVVVLLKLVMKH